VTIELTCDCGKRYRISDQFAGRTVSCKSCGKKLKVPRNGLAGAVDSSATTMSEADVEAMKKLPIEDRPGRLAPLEKKSATRASNPARVFIDRVHALRNLPFLFPFIGVTTVVLFCVGWSIFGSWKIAAGAAVFVAPLSLLQVLQDLTKKAANGDVLPALVIETNPDLVAVLVNLTAGAPKPVWAIKIIKARLDRMADGPATLGQQLAVAAFYAGPIQNGAWQDISPLVLARVTRNRADLQRTLASIPKSQWQKLDAELTLLRHRTPGLHTLS